MEIPLMHKMKGFLFNAAKSDVKDTIYTRDPGGKKSSLFPAQGKFRIRTQL